LRQWRRTALFCMHQRSGAFGSHRTGICRNEKIMTIDVAKDLITVKSRQW